jgi:hypothetical protein
MNNIIKKFKEIFSIKNDPLDEMLIEKGIDPEQLMEDIYYQRQEDGNECAINRVMDRREDQNDRAEKVRKSIHISGNGIG